MLEVFSRKEFVLVSFEVAELVELGDFYFLLRGCSLVLAGCKEFYKVVGDVVF